MALIGIRRSLLASKKTLPPQSFTLAATDNATDLTGLATITFGSKNFAIGTPSPQRLVAVGFGARNNTGSFLATSVSIGGVSATNAVSQNASSLPTPCTAEIWYALVASGTTAGISITFAGANSRAGIQVYSVVAPGVTTPAIGSGNAASGTVSSFSPVVIPSGGAAIGIYYSTGGGPGTPSGSPAAFNNLDLNSNINGTQMVSAIHSNPGTLSGSQTLSIALTSANTPVAAFAAWGP